MSELDDAAALLETLFALGCAAIALGLVVVAVWGAVDARRVDWDFAILLAGAGLFGAGAWRCARVARDLETGARSAPSVFVPDGSTLLTLALTGGICLFLAAIAVPQFERVAEKGRAVEASLLIAELDKAQDAHRRKTGRYANSLAALKLAPELRYFELLRLSSERKPASWSVRLMRRDHYMKDYARKRYGLYRIVFDSTSRKFDCVGGAAPALCREELLP